MKLRKILSFILLTGLFIFMSTFSVKADGPLAFTKGTTIEKATLTTGITWEKYTATSVTDEGTPGTQVVNVATIAPGAAKLVAWAQTSGSGIKSGSLTQAIADYEAKYPQNKVVAAINGDYFAINGDKSMTNGCVMDGAVVKEITTSRNLTLCFNENNEVLVAGHGETLVTSDNYTLEIYDKTGYNVTLKTEIPAINTMPGEGETSYVTKVTQEFIDSNVEYEAYKLSFSTNMKLVNSTYAIATIGDKVTSFTDGEAVLITRNLEVANKLAKGMQIRMYKTLAGKFEGYDNAIGSGGQFLKDGNVQSVADIMDQGTDHVTARHPRTSIGIKPDGSVCIMVIDGRQSDQDMYGVSERENAMCMINEGCSQGFNLDGGGSSTFVILQDGNLRVTNSPSDGGLRYDSDFVLVVVPKVEVEMELSTAASNGKASISGTSEIQTNLGYTYESTEIYVNGIATGQSADNFTINGLACGQEYNVAVYFTSKNGAATSVQLLYSENIKTAGTASAKTAPTNPTVEFTKTSSGVNALFKIDDPTDSIVDVKVLNGTTNAVVNRSFDGALVKAFASNDKLFKFTVTYTYRLGLGDVQTIVEEYEYNYVKAAVEEYTYKFVVDGKVVKEETAVAGFQIVAPEDPTKEGYEFKGWDKEVGELTEDITFTALFEKIEENPGDEPGDEPDEPEKKPSTGGMNCSFGGYFVTSIIAAMSLTAILLKRKH